MINIGLVSDLKRPKEVFMSASFGLEEIFLIQKRVMEALLNEGMQVRLMVAKNHLEILSRYFPILPDDISLISVPSSGYGQIQYSIRNFGLFVGDTYYADKDALANPDYGDMPQQFLNIMKKERQTGYLPFSAAQVINDGKLVVCSYPNYDRETLEDLFEQEVMLAKTSLERIDIDFFMKYFSENSAVYNQALVENIEASCYGWDAKDIRPAILGLVEGLSSRGYDIKSIERRINGSAGYEKRLGFPLLSNLLVIGDKEIVTLGEIVDDSTLEAEGRVSVAKMLQDEGVKVVEIDPYLKGKHGLYVPKQFFERCCGVSCMTLPRR